MLLNRNICYFIYKNSMCLWVMYLLNSLTTHNLSSINHHISFCTCSSIFEMFDVRMAHGGVVPVLLYYSLPQYYFTTAYPSIALLLDTLIVSFVVLGSRVHRCGSWHMSFFVWLVVCSFGFHLDTLGTYRYLAGETSHSCLRFISWEIMILFYTRMITRWK